MTNESPYKEINLYDYFYILRKRRHVIVVSFLAILAAGIFLTYKSQVLYKATAAILIERQNPNIVDFKEVMAFDASTTDYYQTQYQMIKSPSLIERLIQEQGLDKDPYLVGMKNGGLRRFLRTYRGYLPNWLDPFMRERSFVEILTKRMLRVDPLRNSRLVNISILHPDPEQASRITNALVQLYIQKNLESRYLISSQGAKLLSDQVEELKGKVTRSEQALQKYKEENALINIPSVREKDQFIQEAKLELVKIQAEEAKLAQRYLPAHPKRIHIQSQIQGLQQKIDEEQNKNLGLSRVAIAYAQLEREAESARKIYEALLDRIEEMHSEAKTQSSNVVIVDEAGIPSDPDSPKPFVNFLIAGFLGLFLGLILAFFFEYIDSSVKVPDDIEKGLGLELLGIIPSTSKDKNGPLEGEIYFAEGKSSQAAEAFRALRTHLLFRLRHVTGCRVFLITSPNPEEGKSTVSLNMAATFAQNHLKVLLIDGDLRKPRLHERIGESLGTGLTDVLESQVHPQEVIRRNIGGVGVDFLSAGTISHHPTELLGLDRMKKFLEEMKQVYDIIIIDSPPYFAVADVAVVSEYVDAMLVVARYHKTDKRHLRDLRRRFAQMGQKVLGVVINQVSVRERDYYYHQYYYYGYGEVTPKK